jgi:2-polyprenyl-3-methyl-5-hydroxy-6-metoxy-1,4-benzoquinol methylase
LGIGIDFSLVLKDSGLDNDVADCLQHATDSLLKDLQNINLLDLHISEYNQRYLKEKFTNLPTVLSRSAWIIGKSLAQSHKRIVDMVFIEYGGGTGFLSLIAKMMGIGTVIYNDIYEVSVSDAKLIAEKLGYRADYYVQGDIDDLVAFCTKYLIKCDSIVSDNVLEHIYDINSFCGKLHLLSHENTAMVHVTSANMFFFPNMKLTMEQQIEVETQDRDKKWGHRENDCLLSWIAERRRIIADYAPRLRNDEVIQLASITRGLAREDIIRAIDLYLGRNELPKPIEHPTNTCDPHTGNWCEHMMNPYYLVETFTFNGFDTKIYPVYWYKANDSLIMELAKKILNFGIRGTNAPLYFSYGFAIYGRYNPSYINSEHHHRYDMYKSHRSFIWWYLMMPIWEIGFHVLSGHFDKNAS